MTLNTNVWFIQPYDPEKVWADVIKIVARDGADKAIIENKEREGYLQRNTACGQGLDAWTFMNYHENITELFPKEYDHYPLHYIGVDFDTAYGYRSEIGNCSELHASYIMQLDALGYEFLWQNEYTGDIYYRKSGVDSLLEKGRDADEWFHTLVVPALNLTYGS